MLTNEEIKKFQNIWKKCFGKDVTEEEAYKKAPSLLRLVELIYYPMTKEEYDQLQINNDKGN